MVKIGCIAIVMLIVTCQASFGRELPGKFGVYVKFDDVIDSPHALRQAMREIKAAGIDFIIAGGKGSYVRWDSKIAPRELIRNKDYLAMIIKYAHAEGLKVHPCFCVATEGGERGPNALLAKNPSWAFVYGGERKGYIDPGNPQARRYEIDLMVEMVSNYDIDGVSLDYMRAPNRVGYTDSARTHFLKTHSIDLAEITVTVSDDLDTEGGKKVQAKKTSQARQHPVWPEWQRWKRENLNLFMKEIEAAVHKVKPELPIGSYVWGAHTYTGNSEICQDWKTWIKSGWLDWINPSGYRYTDEAFREAAVNNRAAVPKGFPFYITIGVKTSHGQLGGADEIKRQITMAKEAGADGVVFFTWESLHPFAPEVAESLKSWKLEQVD